MFGWGSNGSIHAGAFVAGLDAGHAYNTFPLMDGCIIPEQYWAVGGWRNAFENTAAVQLHHRRVHGRLKMPVRILSSMQCCLSAAAGLLTIPNHYGIQRATAHKRILYHRALALATLCAVTALWAGSRSQQLPRPCRLLVNSMLAMAGVQVCLPCICFNAAAAVDYCMCTGATGQLRCGGGATC